MLAVLAVEVLNTEYRPEENINVMAVEMLCIGLIRECNR